MKNFTPHPKLGPSAISPCVALALGELNFTYQYRVSGGATKGWPVKLRHQIPIEFSLPTRSLGWPSQLRNLGKSFTSIAMRINGSLNGRMARGNRSPCYCERMSYCECINRRRTDNENKIEYKLESPHTGLSFHLSQAQPPYKVKHKFSHKPRVQRPSVWYIIPCLRSSIRTRWQSKIRGGK